MSEQQRARRSDPFVDGILPRVEKPSRYIDGESNLSSRGFAAGGFNILLVYPDVYEIGMSHHGLQVLYHAVAGLEGVGVEFAFAAWPDLEARLRAAAEPLRSWQTGTPAGRFDLVGVTLPYELLCTNALATIDLAGIPIEARERGEDDPLVVAGGPCASNPLPVIGAFDAFFLGDGEESLREAALALRAAKGRGAPRRALLEALAGIDGVYVEGISAGARARTAPLRPADLDRAPIVPAAHVVHDRLAIEIMRGCTRGCRFCHAGMTYRPRRERGVDEIVAAARAGLDASGWEEVSLLSLSSSDYSRLEELLSALAPHLEQRCVSLALPSLRPETVTERIVEALARVRKSGFTIAPEAGTERLRRVINKATGDGEILAGCGRILAAGWRNLKLYFMIGLPTEDREDLDGIASLVDAILRMPGAGGRFRLAVSISPFVPKPHTPFQWERQCSIEEIAEKERYLQRSIRHRRVEMSMRDPRVSALEGILARGGRELWPVVVDAYRSGCRFDGWRDRLRFDLWEQALGRAGLSLGALGAGFDPGRPLPWDAFRSKVTTDFLLRERERAFAARPTPDCRQGTCAGCGACPGGEADQAAAPSVAARAGTRVSRAATTFAEAQSSAAAGCGEARGAVEPVRYRFVYCKHGRARFLSHRELVNMLHRALRRSRLPLRFSEGFHPHPRVSLGPALAVGMEGESEFFDAEFTRDGRITFRAFEGLMPAGIEITASAGPFSRREGRIPEESVCEYAVELDTVEAALERGLGDGAAGHLSRCWADLFARGAPLRDRRGRERNLGGCGLIDAAREGVVGLRIDSAADGSLSPADLLAAVWPQPIAVLAKVARTGIFYRRGDALLGPLDLITGML